MIKKEDFIRWMHNLYDLKQADTFVMMNSKTLRNVLMSTGGYLKINNDVLMVKSKHLGAGAYRVYLEKYNDCK